MGLLLFNEMFLLILMAHLEEWPVREILEHASTYSAL